MRWWLIKAITNLLPTPFFTSEIAHANANVKSNLQNEKRIPSFSNGWIEERYTVLLGIGSYFMLHMMGTKQEQTFAWKRILQALYWKFWHLTLPWEEEEREDSLILSHHFLTPTPQTAQHQPSPLHTHTIIIVIIRALNSPPTSNHPHKPHIRGNTTHPLSMVPLRQSPLCLEVWQNSHSPSQFSSSLTCGGHLTSTKYCYRVGGLHDLLLMILGGSICWAPH